MLLSLFAWWESHNVNPNHTADIARSDEEHAQLDRQKTGKESFLKSFTNRHWRSTTATTLICGGLGFLLMGPVGAGIGLAFGFIYAAATNFASELLASNPEERQKRTDWFYAPAKGAREVRRAALLGGVLAFLGAALVISGVFIIPGLALLGTTGAIAAQAGIGALIAGLDGSIAHALRHGKTGPLILFGIVSMAVLGALLMASGVFAPLGIAFLGAGASMGAMVGLGAGLGALSAGVSALIHNLMDTRHDRAAFSVLSSTLMAAAGLTLAAIGILPAFAAISAGASLAAWAAIGVGASLFAVGAFKLGVKLVEKGHPLRGLAGGSLVTALGIAAAAITVATGGLFGLAAVGGYLLASGLGLTGGAEAAGSLMGIKAKNKHEVIQQYSAWEVIQRKCGWGPSASYGGRSRLPSEFVSGSSRASDGGGPLSGGGQREFGQDGGRDRVASFRTGPGISARGGVNNPFLL